MRPSQRVTALQGSGSRPSTRTLEFAASSRIRLPESRHRMRFPSAVAALLSLLPARAGACAEVVLTGRVGNYTTGAIPAEGGPNANATLCRFLVRDVERPDRSLTLHFNVSLDDAGGCDVVNGPSLHVYDGATVLSPLIAIFRCGESWPIATRAGALASPLARRPPCDRALRADSDCRCSAAGALACPRTRGEGSGVGRIRDQLGALRRRLRRCYL